VWFISAKSVVHCVAEGAVLCVSAGHARRAAALLAPRGDPGGAAAVRGLVSCSRVP